MNRVLLLIGLILSGCAGRVAADDASERCTLAALAPQDIAAVQPLWVPNPTVKSPAYTLGGVIVELRDADAATRARAHAQAAQCASTCSTPAADVQASVGAADGRLEVVLRADDPVTARALLARAERHMHSAR